MVNPGSNRGPLYALLCCVCMGGLPGEALSREQTTSIISVPAGISEAQKKLDRITPNGGLVSPDGKHRVRLELRPYGVDWLGKTDYWSFYVIDSLSETSESTAALEVGSMPDIIAWLDSNNIVAAEHIANGQVAALIHNHRGQWSIQIIDCIRAKAGPAEEENAEKIRGRAFAAWPRESRGKLVFPFLVARSNKTGSWRELNLVFVTVTPGVDQLERIEWNQISEKQYDLLRARAPLIESAPEKAGDSAWWKLCDEIRKKAGPARSY